MKLSILTATYNRGTYLTNIYNSIIENLDSGLDIEWIIIDDGSTDNTKDVVNNFIIDKRIDIKYIYQLNSGKMKAINKGMNNVTGELVLDCDSDDYFTSDAFNIIKNNCEKLLQDKKLYALCFLKQNKNRDISRK